MKTIIIFKMVNKIIKNVNGSSSRKPQSGSWISKCSTNSNNTCSKTQCTQKAQVGAHVINANKNTSNKQYIVPMCKKHNHFSNTKTMTLKSGTKLIRALK